LGVVRPNIALLLIGISLQITTIYGQVSLSELPYEDLRVEVNQSFFIPGESLEVRIERIDESFPISAVVHLELIGDNNSGFIQKKELFSSEGFTKSSIYLPSTLKSGQYTLLVYTQWMKNFGNNAIIQKKVNVINPYITIPKSLQPNYTPSNKLKIKLYPAGGKIRINEVNKIGYEIVNLNQTKTPATVLIQIDSSKQIKLETKTGFGHFRMSLKESANHRITIIDRTENIYFSDFSIDDFEITPISYNENDTAILISGLIPSDNQTILIKNKTKPLKRISVTDADTQVSKSLFKAGINQILIFNNDRDILFNKHFFIQPTEIKGKVDVNKKKIKAGKKVSFSISSEKSINSSVIVRKKYPAALPGNNVSSSFLNPDISNINWPIDELPRFYLFYLDCTNTQNTDLQEITLPDFRGDLLNGSIVDINNEPISDLDFYLTIVGESRVLYPIKTNELGKFSISIPIEHTGSKLIFSRLNESTPVINEEFLSDYSFINHNKLTIHDNKSFDWLLEKSRQVQIKNLYTDYIQPNNTIGYLFDDHERIVFNLDEFNRFPTVADHIIEYIPQIVIQKTAGNSRVFTLRNMNNKSDNYETLVVIDGIVTTANKILKYDPLKIETVEIYMDQLQIGSEVYNGAINFQCYDNVEIGSTQFDYKKLPLKSTYHPSITPIINDNDLPPDMRVQLHWSQELINVSQKQFQVKTSLVIGTYEIVVSGMKEDEFIYQVVEFEVTP